jgi:hypothetical protein
MKSRITVVLRVVLIALATGSGAGCARDAAPPPAAMSAPVGTSGVVPDSRASYGASRVQTEMRNVDLHLDEHTVLHIDRLRGALVSTGAAPPAFDDKRSFFVEVAAAVIRMEPDDLARLMNDYVLAYDGAPLKKLSITTDGAFLAISGTARTGIGVPFSMKATVAPTADGRLRLHADSFKAFGVPAKGLLGLLRVDLDDLIAIRAGRGVETVGDDLILDAQVALPPPAIRGAIVAARVDAGGLTLTVTGKGSPARLPVPLDGAKNFMFYRGGVLRFGKLTMTDTDLLLVDPDPDDPFDFYQDRYNDQLVAGYSKNTPDLGLITYMLDYEDVRARRRAAR